MILHFSPNAVAQVDSVAYVAVKGEHVSRQPYTRYTTNDRLGRSITFYLSEEPKDSPPLPLVAYVHGSSTQSHFSKDGKNGFRGNNGHATIADVMRGKTHLIIIEKPGVEFLGNVTPDHETMSEFRREHSLARWTEAVRAAVLSAIKLPNVRDDQVLVVGHSEGGITAASVAASTPQVTHVACLAGGGPSQLFSLMELARKGKFFGYISDDPDKRVQHLLSRFERIQNKATDPDSIFLGHSYLRWSSFLSESSMEFLIKTEARIFVAQGTKDDAVAPASADVLQAHLLSKGKHVTVWRVDGADHNFQIADSTENGWKKIHEDVRDWLFDQK